MRGKNQVFYTLKQKNKLKQNDMFEKGNHGLNCEKYRQAPPLSIIIRHGRVPGCLSKKNS